jgi:hypothetical protein
MMNCRPWETPPSGSSALHITLRRETGAPKVHRGVDEGMRAATALSPEEPLSTPEGRSNARICQQLNPNVECCSTVLMVRTIPHSVIPIRHRAGHTHERGDNRLARRMIRPALTAIAAAGLLVVGSPLAYSAGGGGGAAGGVGLSFRLGTEPTRVSGWVPFPGTTTLATTDAELQRCRDQARGGAADKDACMPDKGDRKDNSHN